MARMIVEAYDANVIGLDNYFLLDPPHKKYGENGKDWELPENTDWKAINKVVSSIKAGSENVSVRKIDWRSNTYSESNLNVSPLTIVEGFLLLHDEQLVENIDLTVYIDVSDEVGLERRMKREGTTKNKKWFEEVTFPEYKSRRDLFKGRADIVLNGEMDLGDNIKILKERIDQDK